MKVWNNNVEISESPKNYDEFIEKLKDIISEIFMQDYMQTNVILTVPDTVLLLKLIEEIRSSAVNVLYKLYVEDDNEKMINVLKNLNVEILMSYKQDKEKYKKWIKKEINETIEKLKQYPDLPYVIHPIIDIFKFNLFRVLQYGNPKEAFPDYLPKDIDYSEFKINDNIIKKIFSEFFLEAAINNA